MKKLLLALALTLASSSAWAQCNGIFPNATVCGNNSGSPNVPGPISIGSSVGGPGSSIVGDLAIWNNTSGSLLKDQSLTATIDAAIGSTRGSILERGAATWGLIVPSAAGLPFVSNGVGADPSYQVLPVAGGGTGTASGTSGGVSCYTASTTLASSTLLTANAIVFGGGAGVCPSTGLGLGTTTQVLHGNAAGLPSWAAVNFATDGTGLVPLANGGLNANNTASVGGIFWSDATKGNILAGTATANLPLLSGNLVTPSWATITYVTSATSGGVACFTSTTVMASSGLLAANSPLIGGGAGVCPSNVTAGTNGQLFLGVSAGVPAFATLSQDCTITNAGVITCTKTNNVSFTAFATQTIPCLISQGCTGQITALAARASSGLNIDQLTSTGDADYVILSTDRTVTHTALTAPRTDTLPAASSVNSGQHILITDLNGVISGANNITIQRAGSDIVNGSTSTVIATTRGGQDCVSNGTNAWICNVQGSSSVAGVSSIGGLSGVVSVSNGITATGTNITAQELINAQTGTTYAILDTDRAKLITATNAAAQAYSIAQAGAASSFVTGWYVDIYNKSTANAGVVTITPTTSTINGAATLVLPPFTGGRLVSDGTNYNFINLYTTQRSAFRVTKGGVDQTGIADSVATLVTWSTEVYDVGSNFTSNTWTPPAGKVTQQVGMVTAGTIASGALIACEVFKNGSLFINSTNNSATGQGSCNSSFDDIANGTDAYTIEIFQDVTAGTVTVSGNTVNTWWSGHWIGP